MLAIPHVVFSGRDPDLVRELYHLACEEVEGFCSKAAALLGEAEADALAYLDFPHAHHGRLRTNNVQGRANRELKGRSRVVQVFPSKKVIDPHARRRVRRNGRGLGVEEMARRRVNRSSRGSDKADRPRTCMRGSCRRACQACHRCGYRR